MRGRGNEGRWLSFVRRSAWGVFGALEAGGSWLGGEIRCKHTSRFSIGEVSRAVGWRRSREFGEREGLCVRAHGAGTGSRRGRRKPAAGDQATQEGRGLNFAAIRKQWARRARRRKSPRRRGGGRVSATSSGAAGKGTKPSRRCRSDRPPSRSLGARARRAGPPSRPELLAGATRFIDARVLGADPRSHPLVAPQRGRDALGDGVRSRRWPRAERRSWTLYLPSRRRGPRGLLLPHGEGSST